MSDLFLTDEELCSLTGIHKGKGGVPREKLQCEHLRRVGVPFYPNARGKPVVVRDVLTGPKPVKSPKPAWVPKVLQTR